jgi:hypothetical protein
VQDGAVDNQGIPFPTKDKLDLHNDNLHAVKVKDKDLWKCIWPVDGKGSDGQDKKYRSKSQQ